MLGVCHNCGHVVAVDAFSCGGCGEDFSVDRDRQHLGLGLSRPLPGRAPVEMLALRAEPPAGVELVSGPAAIPVATQETRSGINGRRLTDGAGAVGSDAGLDAIKRVDELGRAVRSLRRAWMNERRRSWIALGSAGIITALALVVLLVT